MPYPFVIIVVLVLLIAGLILSYFAFKLKKEEYKATGKYPKGHYMGQGLAIGIALALVLAIAMENIFTGYLIGLVTGTLIGTHLEKKHENELRPLTPREIELKKKTVLIFGALLILGIIAIVVSFYFGF